MYDYTIFPLELFLKSLLFVFNDLTHNYVLALMMLSVFVRCMTTPLEKYANRIVVNEQALQDVLSPQLAVIKETYSGSEKHSAIQRLYSRY
jgi:membrane protein insertase Oxa1/YidC/SpoIIIJ